MMVKKVSGGVVFGVLKNAI
jgi:hypothetical protein